ncbi:MAG: LysR family transcriptional regulator [Oscillospiraceae bacterium]|nr:LysR family transcriptional regulator [Oscillospiraceae bacterium]
MELIQLKYFKTVAQSGKISEAAQSLFISAPALSTSISRLEKELGVQLFDRTGNKIALNQQGHIFLRYVNQIFSNLECAKTELRQSLMHQGQNISIASVASAQWVDLITAFTQENPHFTLSCTSLTQAELSASGLQAQHNFLFAANEDIPPFYMNELESVVLFQDYPVIMVNPEHPLAKQKRIDLQQLQGETIFLPMQNYPLYNHLVKLFEANDIPFPAGNAYSHLMAQQMVANNLGIAFTSMHTVRTPALPLQFIPISNPCIPWTCSMFWRKNHTFTQDETIFKEFVESFYRVR